MPTVNLPRAYWKIALESLDIYNQTANSTVVDILIKEISNQVYSQEY